jgi:hypothetical protein
MMKVVHLKKELEARGVSTKSFEKTEFVKAYAEAIGRKVGKAGSKGSWTAPEERII